MSAGGGPIGRREVAVRCFAAEYDDATLEYSEGDEERAPNYVVTPTGARVNRLFVVGVLTEVESVSDDVLRARVVDPTGAFVVYAGQYQPDAKAALERTEAPAFVAVTGKARTFRPDDGDRVYTSVRPESVTVVDPDTRDRWTVQAAGQTLSRLATAAAALEREERGEVLTEVLLDSGVDPALATGIPRALEHYGTTVAYLAAVRTMALQAAEVVAGEREEVEPLDVAPDEGGAADVDLAGDVTLAAAGGATASGATADAGASSAAPAEVGAEVDGDDDGVVPEAEVASTAPDADTGTEAESEAASPAPDDDTGPAAESDGEEASADEAGADELYEMDEEEREAVESEFGTEFETGNEVDGPGEAGIETPGADEGEEVAEGADGEEGTGPEEAVDDVEAVDEEEAVDAEDAEAGDLVDAAVAAMGELDDGDGADREAVVETVAEERGVEAAAVEDAIEEALMGGRCYEPDDGRLKAI